MKLETLDLLPIVLVYIQKNIDYLESNKKKKKTFEKLMKGN